MHFTQKITKLKKVSLIPFVFASIPLAFIYLFLRDIPFLSTLFIEYVDSGNSIFFPFLTSTIIAFQFTTGHLIDIIIVINIFAFLERGGYHYYVNICLKKNYSEFYLETFSLRSNGTREESCLNSDLLLVFKVDSDTNINQESVEFNLYEKNRIKFNHFSCKNGYCRNLIKINHKQINSLHNFRKKNPLNNNYYTFFQYCSTNNIINYHFPSKNNCIFSNSIEVILKAEGR